MLKKSIYTLIILQLLVIKSFATSVHNAKIERLMIDGTHGENVFIALDKRQTDLPPCHKNVTWEYVLNISNELGKSIYAALLSSYTANKPINLSGIDNCTRHSEIETLRRIELQ